MLTCAKHYSNKSLSSWHITKQNGGSERRQIVFWRFCSRFFGLDFFNANTLIERQQNNNLVKSYFLLEIAFNRMFLTRHYKDSNDNVLVNLHQPLNYFFYIFLQQHNNKLQFRFTMYFVFLHEILTKTLAIRTIL